MNPMPALDMPQMSPNAYALLKDEAEVLIAYRRAKSMGFADLSITVQEGSRVKLWLTEKMK